MAYDKHHNAHNTISKISFFTRTEPTAYLTHQEEHVAKKTRCTPLHYKHRGER